MKTYRMSVPARLCFDVRADDDAEAIEIASAVCERIWEEGAEVTNCDLEDLLANACAYPQPKFEPVEIVDEGEDDLEPGPGLLKASQEGEQRARELYGKGAEVCQSCHGLGWLHIDDAGGNGPEVECCQGCDASGDMEIDDQEAVRRHRIQCGCAWPENAPGKEDFYQARTKMPFATFSKEG